MSNTSVRAAQRTGARIPFVRGPAARFLRGLLRGSVWISLFWASIPATPARAQGYSIQVLDAAGNGGYTPVLNGNGAVLLKRGTGEWQLVAGSQTTSYGFITDFFSLTDANDALGQNLEIRGANGNSTTGIYTIFSFPNTVFYPPPFAFNQYDHVIALNGARRRVMPIKYTTGGTFTVEPVIVEPNLSTTRLGHPPVTGFDRLESYPAAINENGEVAGTTLCYMAGASQPSALRAFLYTNGSMTLLPPLAGQAGLDSGANDLNDQGQITGWNGSTGVGYRGVLWNEGVATDITAPYLEFLQGNAGIRINDLGQVLLAAPHSTRARVIYRTGLGWANLIDLLPAGHPYDDVDAMDLNRSGQLIAFARRAGTSIIDTLLLNPEAQSDLELIPEDISFLASGTSNVVVRNTGSIALNPAATASTVTGGAWLSVSTAPFALGVGAETNLPVTVNFSGLTPGLSYTGTVQVVAAGVTREVVVTARVPSLDSVEWAPGSPQPAPGTPLTFDAAQPSILAPVLVELGSRATAQLSVEAWDQNDRYLGGTDPRRITSQDGPRLEVFALADLGGQADLTGVTAVTLRALLVSDDGATFLAGSDAAIYPVAPPLEATWGFFNEQSGQVGFVAHEWESLDPGLNRFGRKLTPGARLDLPPSVSMRRVEAWVEGYLGTRKTGILTQRRHTVNPGLSGELEFPLGLLVPSQLRGVNRVVFHIAVYTEGAAPGHIALSIPVHGLHIQSSTPASRQPLRAGEKASLDIVYSLPEFATWEIVLSTSFNPSTRTVLASAIGSGSVRVAQIDPDTEMDASDSFDPEKTLTVTVLARQSGAEDFEAYAIFLDHRETPDRILTPADFMMDIPQAKAAFLNLRSDVTRTLSPFTLGDSADMPTENPGGLPPGLPAGGVPIARMWAFGGSIPEDGTFAADLALSYTEADLPDDPGFSENRMQVVALDASSGTHKPLPTTVNPALKTATAPVTGLASSYALASTGPGAMRFLDIPFLRAAGTLTTRLHLCQTGSVAPTSATLSARDRSGELSATPLLNPNAVQVPPQGSTVLPLTEFFGLESSPFGGWVQGTVDAAVLGLLEARSEGRADFLAPPVAATEMVLPLALDGVDGVDTELHLVNPTRFEAVVALTALAADGVAADTASFALPSRGMMSVSLPQLFPALPSGWVGSLRLDSSHAIGASALLLGARAVGVQRMEPVQGQRAGAHTLVSPWFAHGTGSQRSTITLVNTGSTTANVTLRAVADNGSTLGTPAVRTLAAGAQLRQPVGTLLALGAGPVVGALRVECDHNGVRGNVVVEEDVAIPNIATVLPLDSRAWTDPVLATLNESAGFATDLSLHNPGANAQSVWVQARRPDGTLAGQAEVSLPAGGRTTRRLSTLIPACAGLAAGHLAVHCPDGIFAVATVRELSGNSLATVPAQRALLPSQAAAPDLLAWWTFDDASNPAVSLDLVAGRVGTWQQGGHATAAGGGRTGAGTDRAADFTLPGSDRLEVGNAGWLDLAAAEDTITFAFWQRMTDWSTATSFHAVSPAAELGRGAHAHCPWNNGSIYWDTGGHSNPTTWRTFHAPASGFNYFVWHHHALVKNGDIKEVWVDGLRIGVGINTADLARDMNKLFIGAHDPASGPDYHFSGYIDDFTVYRSALRAEQIQDLARGTPPERSLAGPPGNGRVVATIPPGEGSVTLNWSSLPGEMYAVQVSEDLALWRTLRTGLRASAVNSLAVDLHPQGNPTRLYLRVVPQ